MEPNIQNAPNNTPTQTLVTDLKPPKSKALTAITTFAIILAVIGTSFGIYGMFFSTQPEPSTHKHISENPDSSDTTNTSTPPSVDDVTEILAEKYKLTDTEQLLFSGISVNIDNFDEAAKIRFVIDNSEEKFPKKECGAIEGFCLQTVSYKDFNDQLKYYFGNEANLEKKNYDFGDTIIAKIEYSADDDTITIYHRDGVGGTSTYYQYNKIIDTIGSAEDFYALVTSVTVNTYIDVPSDQAGNSGISLSEEDIKTIKESLETYKFNFVKEDGEYKLISIEKA